MGKYLRDISIHLEFGQKLPNNLPEKDFNLTTHTVQNIFWYRIPSKYEFYGISKLNIEISDKNELNEFINKWADVATYKYKNFDFQKYFALSTYEKNLKIHSVLESSLLDILKDKPEKLQELLKITNQIPQNNFELEHESKLSKYNRTRSLYASVVYRINNNGQNAYLKILDKSGRELINDHLIENKVYEYYNNLYKSKWTDNTFQIIKRDGSIFKETAIN